jgi:hypothetical protein
MNLGNALGHPEDPHRYEPDNRLILSKTRIGVEFEFEGAAKHAAQVGRAEIKLSSVMKNAPWAAYWSIKHDGSLHDHGCEYVFARPLFGVDAVSAIESLCSFAKENGYKTNIRTGLHVHVDVRDMNRAQLTRMTILFALFERAIYNIAGNNREDNVFCMPWYKSDRMLSHVKRINTESADILSASTALAQEKYSGLNLDTLARFGSVEFRHALATTDSDWVIKWINVCLSFKRAAQKLDTQPLDMIHQLSAVGVTAFARQVFEDQYEAIAYPRLEPDVWSFGVETAMEILPKVQELIDGARYSWVTHAQKPERKINQKFKEFIDKNKPAVPPEPPRMVFDFEAQPIVVDEFAGDADEDAGEP